MGKRFPWGLHRQRGSATVEYALVGLAIVLALLGAPDVIQLLWQALQKAYTAFYFAISVAL